MIDLKKIYNARKQILEGVTNTIFKKQFIEDVAADREKHCNVCPYRTFTECEIPGTGPCCKICGCVLKFKVRSLTSECPADKPYWTAVVTEDEEMKHELYYDDNEE